MKNEKISMIQGARTAISSYCHFCVSCGYIAQALVGVAFSLSSASVLLAQQQWRTDGASGTWTAANWSVNGGVATPTGGTVYTANNNANFSANSTVTYVTNTNIGNVTVASGVNVNVTAAGTLATNSAVRTFDVGANSTLTWTGQNWSTAAGVGFIKNGSGTWDIGVQGNALAASNGGFTLNNGTVIAGGNNSFGGSASLLTLNGGTIQTTTVRNFANNITFGGNITNAGSSNATFSGTVALGSATRTITNSLTSGSRIYSGVISGASGSGLTFDGAGAGLIYIGNAANSFTGTISFNGGEVGFASNGAFGNANNSIVIDGGRLTASTTAGAAATYTLASTHGIQVGDGTGTAINVVPTGTLTYNGIISDKASETGSWSKQGTGTLVLGGASTYTGATAISSGIVQLTTGNDRLPTGTVVSLGQTASANLGTLDLNGFSQTIAGLNSTTGTNATTSNNTVTSTASATLTLGGSGTYSYGDGTNANSGVIAGAVSLVKSGTGTQTLGDVNTYAGSTTVSGGTLSIASSGSIAGSGVTVGSGGVLNVNGQVNTTVSVAVGGTLSGTGTITGATSVSGTHNIGNSPGLQVFGDNLSYVAASVAWELEGNATSGRGTTFDGVNVGGNLDFSSPSVLNLDFATGVDWNDAFWSTEKLNTNGWLIYDVTGSTTGFGNLSLSSNFLDVNGASLVSVRSGASFSLFSSGSDIYLNFIITAVPEPSSLALVGLTVCGAVMARRRKQC